MFSMPDSTRWRLPVGLFLSCALVFLATLNPNPSPDAYTADFAAWHIARTGDPVPQIAQFPLLDDNIIRETWIVETTDGREAVGRAPGVIALAVPAYYLAGASVLSPIPGAVSAALLSAAAVLLFFLLLRRRLPARHALIAALLFAFATPVWSVAADAMWPHTITTLGIVAMAWAADRERWWLVGLLGGLTLWGRLHAAVICAVLGLGISWRRRRPAIAFEVALISGLCLALLSAWTRWMYGSWNPTSAYRVADFTGQAGHYALDVVNYLGLVVSADRGLLWWCPLLVVLLPAMWRNWAQLPDWSRWLVISGGVYLLGQAVLNRFSGGDHFYGYRTSLEFVIALAPALALSAHRMGPMAQRWFAPVALLQVAVISVGAVSDDFYSPVRDVWWRNSFLDALVNRPTEALPVVASSLLVCVVLTQLLRRRTHNALATDRANSNARRAHAGAAPAKPQVGVMAVDLETDATSKPNMSNQRSTRSTTAASEETPPGSCDATTPSATFRSDSTARAKVSRSSGPRVDRSAESP